MFADFSSAMTLAMSLAANRSGVLRDREPPRRPFAQDDQQNLSGKLNTTAFSVTNPPEPPHLLIPVTSLAHTIGSRLGAYQVVYLLGAAAWVRSIGYRRVK